MTARRRARRRFGAHLSLPNSHRLYYLADALRLGVARAEIHQLTKIDPWFIDAIAEIVATESADQHAIRSTPALLREFKAMGFSDRRIAELTRRSTKPRSLNAARGRA